MELDSVLFPVNYVNYSQSHFGPEILQKAKDKGMARLALKAFAKTTWKQGETHTYAKCWYRPIEDQELAERALRFTLSEDCDGGDSARRQSYFPSCARVCAAVPPALDGRTEATIGGRKWH
jgi:hypothetical protein